MAKKQDLRTSLFTQLSGLRGDVSGSVEGDLRGMLLAVGGASSRTKSGIDLTRAAAELGVTRRTAERWLKAAQGGPGTRPSNKHLRQIARKAASKATTKRGRAAVLASSPRVEALRRHGGRLTIEGNQGPYSLEYRRYRVTSAVLPPEAMNDLLDTWGRDGERAALTMLEDLWSQHYMRDNREDGWFFDAAEFQLDLSPDTRRGVH